MDSKIKLPIEEQDIRFEDIVCNFRDRYKTKTIRTDEMMSVRISDLFILRNDGFSVSDVLELWEERGWVTVNEDYKKGDHGGVEFSEFELTEKFPTVSRLRQNMKRVPFLAEQGQVKIEIIARDKIVQEGNNNQTTINN